mmetsp:Transcript_40930/g.47070  ORF Transcript_40930/g.47070 Transcript_40930/m.47070 type:complete len:242 (-) Transcript_40930:481-1206(-)
MAVVVAVLAFPVVPLPKITPAVLFLFSTGAVVLLPKTALAVAAVLVGLPAAFPASLCFTSVALLLDANIDAALDPLAAADAPPPKNGLELLIKVVANGLLFVTTLAVSVVDSVSVVSFCVVVVVSGFCSLVVTVVVVGVNDDDVSLASSMFAETAFVTVGCAFEENIEALVITGVTSVVAVVAIAASCLLLASATSLVTNSFNLGSIFVKLVPKLNRFAASPTTSFTLPKFSDTNLLSSSG